MDETTSHAGRLLVATPLIGDGTFHQTVVHLIAHSDEGAFGVILNRPSDTPAHEVLVGWGARAAAPGVVFVGGPVDGDTVVGLGVDGSVDLQADPDEVPDAPEEVRLFAGRAGWGPGQLEEELGQQAWWVVDAAPGDLLTRDPAGLWQRVLRRQPRPTAWYANYPDDLRTG
ncbi:YqgE/AlgH family protein [Iamia majanohamensis]|uniref:YqgE/AlgH family protein n=1 Tax=Iamia majanohamensis TaxID=467976 RepID=A0AAE9YA40_9ACTN|nr:YqgE/AlgH family protein [Iamia majanohamensis]WCO67423.1 YqgE/AlgH family protein [Iamia majanohamensis]